MREQARKNVRIDVLGIELEWQLRRSDTQDQYCVLTAIVRPETGVPLHQHREQEAFFVLEGHPEFAVDYGAGTVWKQCGPGDMINIPSDALHGFRNTSKHDVRVLITCQGALGKFFEEAGTPLAENEISGATITPEAVHRVLAIARRLGQRFPEAA